MVRRVVGGGEKLGVVPALADREDRSEGRSSRNPINTS